jgi:hypothetical protein
VCELRAREAHRFGSRIGILDVRAFRQGRAVSEVSAVAGADLFGI